MALLVAFFGVGFLLIGPRLRQSAMPLASPTSTLSDQDKNWGQAPVPKRQPRREPKPAPKDNSGVTVVEVSPSEAASTPEASGVGGQSEPSVDRDSPLARTEPSPAAVREQNSPLVSTVDSFVVQVGVFASRTNAEFSTSRLADLGYRASIRRTFRAGQARYQVLVGSPKGRVDADKLASDLKDAGEQAFVVPAN